MDKPKFVMSKKEMLEFNDACGEAARHGWNDAASYQQAKTLMVANAALTGKPRDQD